MQDFTLSHNNKGHMLEPKKQHEFQQEYDVFELEKKKPKPRKDNIQEPLSIRG